MVIVHVILSADLREGVEASFHKVNQVTKAHVISVTQGLKSSDVLRYRVSHKLWISVDRIEVPPSSIIILANAFD